MNIQTLLPPPSIARYVSDIVVIEHDHVLHETVLPLIARGYPSITFQLTGGAKQPDNLVLYGQNIKPIELHIAGQVTMIAYFLYPFVLKPLFGWHARELTDLGIDLSLSEPARDMRLKEQLLNAVTLKQRLQLLDSYVLKLSGINNPDVNNSISFATQVIQQSKGLVSLTNVQKELYVTERTLQRMFELHVGVSPKTFSRICQFHSALQQLSRGQFAGMADIAYANGYADQSHLIRAFKEFTNHTPLEYLKGASDFAG